MWFEPERRPGKRKPTKARAWWLALLPLIAACSGPRIHVEVGQFPTQVFSRYSRYCWWRAPLATHDPAASEALLDWRVRNAVDAALADKGYARTPGRSCEFVVVYAANVKTREVETFGEFADYRARGGEGGLQDVLGGYPEGTLVLQLYDAATREPLWRASASAVADPAKQEKRVVEAVNRMFKDLPRCSGASASHR